MKKILVVDDEKPLAAALKMKLAKAGFNVESAVSGDQALEYLKKDKFDLVLLDLLMPGTDGWTVLPQATAGGAKVIITSNLGQQEDIAKATAMGAAGFIVKSNSTLEEIVKQVEISA